jgi:predicted O-methyltransferase YrrM
MKLTDFFPFAINDKVLQSNTMTPADLLALSWLISSNAKDCMVAYEVGSWTGMSSCLIGQTIKPYGGKLFCIDNFKGCKDTWQEGMPDIKRTLESNLEKFGVSATVIDDDSVKASNLFSDRSADIVFIDADHKYSSVKNDILAWMPKVKKGGIICGHDLNTIYYDEKYVEDDCVGGIHHGVAKAVLEIVPNFKRVMINGKSSGSVWWEEVAK